MNKGSCKKQIYRHPGIHVTDEGRYVRGEKLPQNQQAAREHWLPKEKKGRKEGQNVK